MTMDPKREILRHLVATVAYRGRVAVTGAPEEFANFRAAGSVRSPVEILAHIGDLLVGSKFLMAGEFVELTSASMSWNEEIQRFYSSVQDLDAFLTTDTPLAFPVEKFVQGPIGDALTHVGQIVMLRRIYGDPVRPEPYFTVDIVPGSDRYEY